MCKRYRLLDRIEIRRLHQEYKILGLEQRRRKQLLRLKFLHSKVSGNIKVPLRVTRAVSKVIFKTATKCTRDYMKSPFYKGTLLWNELSVQLQRMQCFMNKLNELKKLYVTYEEIW